MQGGVKNSLICVTSAGGGNDGRFSLVLINVFAFGVLDTKTAHFGYLGPGPKFMISFLFKKIFKVAGINTLAFPIAGREI